MFKSTLTRTYQLGYVACFENLEMLVAVFIHYLYTLHEVNVP